MRRFSFHGTAEQIGEAFGEACRDEISQLYHFRVANALAQAKEYGGRTVDEATLLRLSARCLLVSERFDPQVYRELLGIARGSGLSPEQIPAMNGLTDFRDVLAFGDLDLAEEGCSSFIITGERTRNGHT